MTLQFTLRAMRPEDGPALVQLMENDPETQEMSMTTRFTVDPYRAWTALQPDLLGVVAEASGIEGLIGAATVAFMDAQYEGQVRPSAFLENLKVHHEYRGQGIGTALAQWRFDRARERFGDEGVILTGTSSDNTASIATMKKWSKQFAGPLTIAPRQLRDDPPAPLAGITIRPAEAQDLAEIAEKSNRFYADYNLYTPFSADSLDATLKFAALNPYHYRIAVDGSGNIVAGALISERSKLLVDEFRNVPPPLLMSGMIPPDKLLRLLEVGSMWFENLDAVVYLWEYMCWEFHDRANSLSAPYDARSPINDLFKTQPSLITLDIILAINGPVPMDEHKWIANRIRG
jgi:GNAT superfamily N-acetyltransferase